MNEMYKYLKEHSYISQNKKSNYQFELSSERAECIANKYENLINDLQQENKKLRQQLYELGGVDEYNRHLINKQQQFIKYLEDEIKKEKKDLEHLCDLYKIPQKNNSTYKFVYSYINKIEKILQKYKEITQTKSDKSV